MFVPSTNNWRFVSVKLFSKCYKDSPIFDDCLKDGLNGARPYFKYGVPEFNIPPFDPFFIEEIIQNRGSQSVNYKLTLRNVFESGWTNSKVYALKSDLKKGYLQYFQWFPEKFVQGEWEIESNFMAPYANSGTFNLTLCEYYLCLLSIILNNFLLSPFSGLIFFFLFCNWLLGKIFLFFYHLTLQFYFLLHSFL